MTTTIEVMKQALKALENVGPFDFAKHRCNEAIAALRSEIARLENVEPYGRFTSDGQGYLSPDQNGMALYLHPAPADESLRKDEKCTWECDDFDGSYDGSCGVKWQFIDGGPEENNMRYCPECGRQIDAAMQEKQP